ncbi:MAG: GH36 C-terminal domain-containing protein, partial [Armatimonadota bacterium]
PSMGKGVVQVFRRDEAKDDARLLKLRGLEPDAKYSLRDLDGTSLQQFTGRTLMDVGFYVKLKDKPGSAIFLYARLP